MAYIAHEGLHNTCDRKTGFENEVTIRQTTMFQFHRRHQLLPFLFFSLLLVIGISIHGDYGLSWDDPVQRQLGLSTCDYITGKNQDLLGLINRYYNPLIEALEVLPEKILQPKSERAVYLSKHLINFLFCWAGLIFFYLLALQLFKDYRFALLSCLLFVLTPRLFAQCFYNSKDLPFLFLFITSIYCLFCWMERPSWKNIFWLAISSGALTGARVLGIMIPALALVALLISMVQGKMGVKEMKMPGLYFLLYPVAVYIFFPAIWQNPVTGFLEAVKMMSHFPYDVTTFFMGATVHSLQTPWYYMPVWMAITIPIGWWFFFLAGIFFLIRFLFKEGKQFSVLWLIILLWLIVPLAAVIILQSNLYEDGRHLFFIEPAFLLIAVAGIRSLLMQGFSQKDILKKISIGVASVVLLVTSYYESVFMISCHPYQYVYFNLPGRKVATDYFDKDYWGVSYRSALEFLVRYDKSDHINVNWKIDPCEWNLVWLNDYDRGRISRVKYNECDYYITNYRSHHPMDASDKKIYEVNVQGITIMAVYEMHPPTALVNPLP